MENSSFLQSNHDRGQSCKYALHFHCFLPPQEIYEKRGKWQKCNTHNLFIHLLGLSLHLKFVVNFYHFSKNSSCHQGFLYVPHIDLYVINSWTARQSPSRKLHNRDPERRLFSALIVFLFPRGATCIYIFCMLVI